MIIFTIVIIGIFSLLGFGIIYGLILDHKEKEGSDKE